MKKWKQNLKRTESDKNEKNAKEKKRNIFSK